MMSKIEGVRTFGDLKQFFDIQTGTDDSAGKKPSKKKKLNKEVQEADSAEATNHSVTRGSLDEPHVQHAAAKDSEDTPAGAESPVKPNSLQHSKKNISSESEKGPSSQVPDATASTLEQQSGEDSSKDTSQQ